MVTTLDPPKLADPHGLGQNILSVLKTIGFEPTGKEQAAVLKCRKKFKLVVGGGQAGKSITASADFILHYLEDTHTGFRREPDDPLLYWLLAADYARTEREFSYISDFLYRLGLPVDASKRLDPGSIEVHFKGERKPRLRIDTKSGKDPRSLAMYSPNGIVVCEASQIDLETFLKAQERVAASNGWMNLSGTYEGSLGWYPSIAKAWSHGSETEQSFILPSPTNFHVYPQGLETPSLVRLRKQSSDQWFLEKIMGQASPPEGLVFKEFRPDVHIRDHEYDPNLPVFICHDPGYGHANAIEVFQVAKGGQIRVIDEIYERGVITSDMITIAMKRDWWANPDKTLVVDPNYVNQHHSGPSMADVWLEKTGLVPLGEKVKVAEGVDRLKSFLKVDIYDEPGIVWHSKCKGVLSELGAYTNPFDDQVHVYRYKLDAQGNVIGEDPEQMWNDGISATIYGVVYRFGLAGTGSSELIMQRHSSSSRRRVTNIFDK